MSNETTPVELDLNMEEMFTEEFNYEKTDNQVIDEVVNINAVKIASALNKAKTDEYFSRVKDGKVPIPLELIFKGFNEPSTTKNGLKKAIPKKFYLALTNALMSIESRPMEITQKAVMGANKQLFVFLSKVEIDEEFYEIINGEIVLKDGFIQDDINQILKSTQKSHKEIKLILFDEEIYVDEVSVFVPNKDVERVTREDEDYRASIETEDDELETGDDNGE